MENNIIRIGCVIPDKKKKKIKFDRFEELCRQCGARVIELDLTRPVEEQGPFDVILHKINDEILVRAEVSDDGQARDQVRNFKRFVATHPGLPVLDNLSHIHQLQDRKTMFSLLKQFQNTRQDCDIFVPSFVEITNPLDEASYQRLRNAGVQFPCVCKPSDAGNPQTAHDMSLVFNERGLHDVTTPCVAQSFINHNGIMYKLFIVGSKTFLVQRPSIKNLYPGDYSTVHFKTHEVSKPNSHSHLNEAGDIDEDPLVPDPDAMHELGQAIRTALGINLLGVDVIMECKTGRYGLIDVNPFPGFDGVSNIPEVLKDFVLEQAHLYRKRIKQSLS